jgi:23S rRNA (cytidine1920-2'-O)/16S rRNA (cytidine1409-2'-O)-methyltransferase
MSTERADVLLVQRGLVESRNLAQRLIMAGQVRANDVVVSKPSSKVALDAALSVDSGPKYVSRGGEKLEAALDTFSVDPSAWICADAGASTGGFSDCLLQRGASKIYAIDVGKGILHWKLRQDPRVVVMEKTNARHLDELPEPVDLVVVDVSFISLEIILPVIQGWLSPTGMIVALIKPQFEAGRAEAAKGAGVIRDPAVHRRVLEQNLERAAALGLLAFGLIRSPIKGPKGNIEFLMGLQKGPPQPGSNPVRSAQWIDDALVGENKI